MVLSLILASASVSSGWPAGFSELPIDNVQAVSGDGKVVIGADEHALILYRHPGHIEHIPTPQGFSIDLWVSSSQNGETILCTLNNGHYWNEKLVAIKTAGSPMRILSQVAFMGNRLSRPCLSGNGQVAAWSNHWRLEQWNAKTNSVTWTVPPRTNGFSAPEVHGLSFDGSIAVGQSDKKAMPGDLPGPGAMAGGWMDVNQAAIWRHGNLEELGCPANCSATALVACSDDGKTACGFAESREAEGSYNFIWKSGWGIKRISMPPNLSSVQLERMAGDGRLASGWCEIKPQDEYSPCVWSPDFGVLTFAAFLSRNHIATPSWKGFMLRGMSRDGRVFVGYAKKADGRYVNWVLRLPAKPH